MKSFLVVGVLLSCVIGGQAGDAFSKINSHLEKTVKSDDLEANLQAAKNLLLKENQSNHCLKPFHTKIAGPLEKFIQLADLQGPNHCDWSSHLIFVENNELTDGKARQEVNPARRIDRLVRKYTVDHATTCKDVYRTKFADIVSRFAHYNTERFNSVKEFADPLMKILTSIERFLATKSNLKDEVPEPTKSLTDSYFDRTVLEYVYSEVVADDLRGREETGRKPIPEFPWNKFLPAVLKSPTRRLLWNLPDNMYIAAAYSTIKNSGAAPDLEEPVDEARWAKLFSKYITEPCKFYTIAVGQDAIEPAAYNSAFAPEEYKDSEMEFYKGWFRHEICKNIVTGDSSQLFGEMMALIKGNEAIPRSPGAIKELFQAREIIIDFFKKLD